MSEDIDIHYTAEFETIEDMKALLKEGINIDTIDEFGGTPLK